MITNLNTGDPDCPLCRGKGEYYIGGSFGGGVTTYKCNCKPPTITDISPENETKPVVENIGEEFMTWAEKYWGIGTLMSKESSGNESCPYSYIRRTFVNKINELTDNKR